MRMLGNMLKFAAVMAVLSVAPAMASQRTMLHRSPCPHERAREAAAAAAALRAAPPPRAATKITLSDRLPAVDRWFSGLGGGSGVLNP
jgi:hypothetical protein